MKKTYINPKTFYVIIDNTYLMAESLPQATMSKDRVNAASVESRRGSFWEDEEE